MSDRLGGGAVTVDLHEIQATVLRYRTEPYFGSHIMLHVDDAHAGREFLQTFNVVRGGEYLFMPSLSALRWLAELGGAANS